MRSKRGLPRFLLLRFGYFLERELMSAFAMEGIECTAFFPEREVEPGPAGYAKGLLEKVATTKANVVLSINGLGIDYTGPLPDMLARLGARFATWYVDSPELFLHALDTPNAHAITTFCCDPEANEKIGDVHYLPLACDSSRFKLEEEIQELSCPIDVSFIGSSWVDKLALTHRDFSFPASILTGFKPVAQALATTPHQGSFASYMEQHAPAFYRDFKALSPEDQRGALHLISWEANRIYRLENVRRTMPFSPVIAGDRHWQRQLKDYRGTFTYHPSIGYYTPDLAKFYRSSRINFSPSGIQMRQAINQRTFDVPAAGAFLLSDQRAQLDALFEPGVEAVSYANEEEIESTINRYLNDRPRRLAIINAARKRIAAEHTYRHRVLEICKTLAAS